MADINYSGENPTGSFIPAPAVNTPQIFANSLDSMFNNVIRQKVANSQVQAQQQQIAQAKQEQALQRGQAALANAAFGGPDPIRMGQQLMQNPQAAGTDQFNLDNHINNYANAMAAQYQLGIQGQQQQLQKQALQNQLLGQGAEVQARNLGLQNNQQQASTSPNNNTLPVIPDPLGNQYLTPVNPETGAVTFQKVEPRPSMSVGGQNIPLQPGQKYEAPPTDAVNSADDLLRTKSVSDQLFGLYNKLAAQGRVGKLAGTWDEKVGQFTGGSKNPDAVAFQNLASGLTSSLKTGQNRLNPTILDNLQKMFSDPTLSKDTVNKTKTAVDTAINSALAIHTASYPTEAARIGRVKQALDLQNQQSAPKVINSKVDYDALPSGASFTWNGQQLVKR